MRSKRKLFELLALKEKVERNKFLKRAKSIASEIEKNNTMKAQLKEIAANKGEDQKTVTALQLRSDKWYDFQIQEQIDATENRVNFLVKENEQVTKKIAFRNQKLKKTLEKIDLHKKLEFEDLEKKSVQSSPPNINKGQAFNS